MRAILIAGLFLAAFAVPVTAHPHGAKSKRHYAKKSYTHRARRTSRRYRSYRRYRRYRTRHCASSGPFKYYPQYPFWAACAFAPKNWR